jgi:hypothetical protein
MITFFAIPKAFTGSDAIRQKNAILSWKKACPGCEILLFGSEEGMEEAVKSLKVVQFKNIKKNEYGTPYLDYVFEIAKKIAKNNILVYSNADIVFNESISRAIGMLKDIPSFLMVGRRLDLNESGETVLHGYCGIDYFIFPKNLPICLPPFLIGRPSWDGWMIHEARVLNIPVIDATNIIRAVHQNHAPNYGPMVKNEARKKEVSYNRELALDNANSFTIREANLILTKDGFKKPSFPRSINPRLAFYPPWRFLVNIRRKIKNYFYEKKHS